LTFFNIIKFNQSINEKKRVFVALHHGSLN
jgi:hypothetical protein